MVAEGPDTQGGVADNSLQLYANVGWGSCTTHGPDIFASAVNWAVDEGARIFNVSWSIGYPFGSQTTYERFLDYVAGTSNIVVAAAVGNGGISGPVTNKLYNGLSVGGANDFGSTNRAHAEMYNLDPLSGSQSGNWEPSGATHSAFEVPHVVAPAVSIDTGGDLNNEIETWTGTSFAAPQVAGLVADIHEGNPTTKNWPEALIVGIMASANENVDEAQGGVWPLSLNDAFDDYDGAGLINAFLTAVVLSSTFKQNGGNTPVPHGHDYGVVASAGTPAGSNYPEEYFAEVGPNGTLRVVSITLNGQVCVAPSATPCSSEKVVRHSLRLWSEATLLSTSMSTTSNYQIVSVKNTTGSTKTYKFRMKQEFWPSGVIGTSWAIAWSAA